MTLSSSTLNQIPAPSSVVTTTIPAALASQKISESVDRVIETLDTLENNLEAIHSPNHPSGDNNGGTSGLSSPRKTFEVSVVIPVYNEAKTILEVVNRVLALPLNLEVIVVDDGSKDGTGDQLRTLPADPRVQVHFHSKNQGKGAALRTGIKQATGEFVVIQDADLEYDPINILEVVRPLQFGFAEVVYGSRYLVQQRQDSSLIHRFGNWLLTSLSNLMTRQHLTDMETCYKAFPRTLIQSIEIQEDRFGFEPEITAKLARREAHIHEVSISYQPRGWSEGKKIGWRDLVRTLYCIVKYSVTDSQPKQS